MNPLLDRITGSPAAAVLAGYDGELPLIDLTVGTPWYGPPESFRAVMAGLVAAGRGELRRHDAYAAPRGAPELREAVARHYLDRYRLRLDPGTQILITHGATGAIWTAVLAASGIGDEVLLPDPCYTLYEPIVTVLGRRPVRVAGDPAGGLLLDPDAVRSAITPATALLLLNSPVNPTGAMYDRARMTAIVEAASAAGVYLVHDEVLDCFARRQRHVPAIALAEQGVAVANSLSKRLGITGWRLGWLAGDTKLVSAAARLHPLTSIAVNHAAQLAAAAALTAADHEQIIARRAREMATAGRDFLRVLSAAPGLKREIPLPDGGVYAFVDVTGMTGSLGCDGGSGPPDVAVARALRDRSGVALLPGSVFGGSGAGYVRISLAAHPQRLAEAGRRLAGPR